MIKYQVSICVYKNLLSLCSITYEIIKQLTLKFIFATKQIPIKALQ